MTHEIRFTIQLLAYLDIGVVTQSEDEYRVTTDYENEVQLVRSLETLSNLLPKMGAANNLIDRFRRFRSINAVESKYYAYSFSPGPLLQEPSIAGALHQGSHTTL
ncbi:MULTISPECIES: hypothetical protein [Haloferacaceae]|uniref:Uncharacterized protein n=1 Tax=Halorubrum glutamatedens TaxID=2707018 RepID=A0ABD5QUT5_9EURY|nr:hypothetical protein [Halobellus captivus]